MKTSIKTKNKLYRRYKNTRNPEHELQYKQYRNKLNKLLFEAEKDHYEKLLNENRNNLRKSWRILKDVINKKKVTSSCSKFVVSGKTTTDKIKIANGFNQYFVNLAQLWQVTSHRIISRLRHTWKVGFLKVWLSHLWWRKRCVLS